MTEPLQFRWALRRHPTQPGLIDLHVQEIAGDRGIVMSVTSRTEAREALPYLRGEVARRKDRFVAGPCADGLWYGAEILEEDREDG